MIRLRNINKSYQNKHVLKDISFELVTGQTTALIGPSGCGKSTLLRIMIGLIQPDLGEVFFQDQRILPENVLELRKRMGYVIQDGGLFPHLTAKENACLMASFLEWSDSKIDKRLNELAELTQIPQELLNRYPIELSGGQRQRIALIRALMLEPEVLLLDEPLGALDPMVRAELQADLKEIFNQLSQTVVIVTHDMGEACYLGDDIILLKDGEVLQRGDINDLVHQPKNNFVTDFINAQRSPLEQVH